MNLQAWRNEAFVVANYSPPEIESLNRELSTLAGRDLPTSSITFGRRRIVFERR